MVTTRGTAFIVKRFPREHYTVAFSPSSGFFARIEDAGHDEPFWSEHGPETLDVAVTNWCDCGCALCYRKSNTAGAHLPLNEYEEIIRQAHSMHVFQVALGGGNPNQHPEFPNILRLTREKYGIVPNYTTNGRGLTQEVIDATVRYCGAVAVSAHPPYHETTKAIELLQSNGITTHIHFVLTSKSIDTAIDFLINPPSFLKAVKAIVFLNYKPVGRLADEELLLRKSCRVQEFFKLCSHAQNQFSIGFDTCSITGLARYGNASDISIEGCDAGRFSLFVSERMEVFPCSFMVEAGYPGIPLRNTSISEIWKNHLVFRRMRGKHSENMCPFCPKARHCLSGCPLFPEINLCPETGTIHSPQINPPEDGNWESIS